MHKKKALIEEEVKKAWTLANLIKEANVAQPTPATAQPAPNGSRAPQQGAQPATATQQMSPQQIDKNAETALSQALSDTIKNLPNILKNFTATVGDKDKQLDVPGVTPSVQSAAPVKPATGTAAMPQAKPVQEGVLKFDENKFKEHHRELNEAGLLGLALSAPAIVGLAGKVASWSGKKLNAQWLQKAGHWAEHLGHSWHGMYIKSIAAMITPLMPGVPPDKVNQVAEALLMTIVSTLFAGGVASPDLLTGVKGHELATYTQKILGGVMFKMGFA